MGKKRKRSKQAAGDPAPAAAAPDIPQQIEKLGDLLEKGLINQEEYDEKKSDLLSRI